MHQPDIGLINIIYITVNVLKSYVISKTVLVYHSYAFNKL